jgi:dihydrodipicolinate synthase/N-acetylneuraminate lyase
MALMQTLLPEGLPRLWCPPLTHFEASGRLDRPRITAHLQWLGPHARGWLIPGSTGEGWQLSDDQARELLDIALPIAQQVGARVLIGVLRRDTAAAVDCLRETTGWLCQRSGTRQPLDALVAQHVCGFTVCPPTGSELTERDLRQALRELLQLELPLALYQLPQVTQNEMSPELVAELAAEFPHFYLLKDTSGADRVATSGVDLADVYLVRGAEGDYARWLKAAGGPYDGFLLSSANVFADRLSAMIELLEQGRPDAARRLIAAPELVVQQVFRSVASLPFGNSFTNANKAIDHWLAFGSQAERAPAPRLHGGQSLPEEILDEARTLLADAELLPVTGCFPIATRSVASNH